MKGDQHARSPIATWTILYGRDKCANPSEKGTLVYCKSTLTGEEDRDTLEYRKRMPSFPNISTFNQWFAESAFEAYRALGLHIGRKCADELRTCTKRVQGYEATTTEPFGL
jgi:hypothetical protein